MLKRIFILFLLSSCSLSVFAQEQELYSFLNKPLSDKLLAIGVSIMPVEANQQNESLRRVVFNNTEKPRLTLTSAWDLTEKDSISLRIQNAMDWDLTLYVTLTDTDNSTLNAVIALPAGPAQNLVIPLKSFSSRTWGMREGITRWQSEGNLYLLPTSVVGKIDTSKINTISLSMDKPAVAQSLLIGTMNKTDADVEQMAYYHLVDKYGQNTRMTWPQKILSNKQLKTMAEEESQELVKWSKNTPTQDIYGGIGKRPQFRASKYFRTEKYKGRWYFVSPNGYAFISLGVNTVTPDDSQTYIDGRDFMFASLPDAKSVLARFYGYANTSSGNAAQGGLGVDKGKWFDFYQANLYRTYGINFLDEWHENVIKRFKAWGFNTIGNWSDNTLIGLHKLPYTRSIYIRGDYNTVSSGLDWWGYMPDTFDPKFSQAVDDAVKLATKDNKNDPWLIGYFADNELSWGKLGDSPTDHYSLVMNVLAQTDTSPAKQAFLKQLKGKYTDITKLAKAWGIDVQQWDAIASKGFNAPQPSAEHPAIEQDYGIFLANYADHYFKTVKDSLKKHDPHHLFLGNRFAVKLPEVISSCAKFCDVISFNTYTMLASQGYDTKLIAQLDRPIMITEFSFGSKTMGALWGGPISVTNEKERGESYQRFVSDAFADPHMVGTHWFQYIDEPLTGRLLDGENGHVGLVNITDRPAHELIKKVKETNINLLEKIR